jgi:hypothetical protein
MRDIAIAVAGDHLEYHDEQLAVGFINALMDRDKERMRELLIDVDHRMNGRCMCSAHSANECTCGAWD